MSYIYVHFHFVLQVFNIQEEISQLFQETITN